MKNRRDQMHENWQWPHHSHKTFSLPEVVSLLNHQEEKSEATGGVEVNNNLSLTLVLQWLYCIDLTCACH